MLTSQGDGPTVQFQKTKSVRCNGTDAGQVAKPAATQSTHSALELNKKGIGRLAIDVRQNAKNLRSPRLSNGSFENFQNSVAAAVTERGQREQAFPSEEVTRFDLKSEQ